MNVSEWLNETKAGDVLVTELATLQPTDTLAHAAEVFLREQVSGAPIIDESGRCVGVLSATDIEDVPHTVEKLRRFQSVRPSHAALLLFSRD